MIGRCSISVLAIAALLIVIAGPVGLMTSDAVADIAQPSSTDFIENGIQTATGGTSLHVLDWIVLVGYFALLLGIAWWVILKNRDTADDYFLAGRNLSWWIVGASIFASNIGSEHLVGLAGSGASDGVAMAHYELHAWCLLVLGWIFVPFYARSKVFTMPEFLERRFSPMARTVLSIISLVAYVLTKIAVGIFAGGIVFRVLLPEMNVMGLDSFWIGSILVIVLTGLYTVLGGFRAVAYTEAVQTLVLVVGSVLVTIFGLIQLGGWDGLREVCGSDMFNLWKPLVPEGVEATWQPVSEVSASITESGDVVRSGTQAWYFNGNYPWLGMLFCAPIIGLWYWCTDQYIVQRALGAPDEREARRGSIFAAFLKLLPVFIFIIPGMICFAVYQKGELDEMVEFNPIGETKGDFFTVRDPNASGDDAFRLVAAGKMKKTVEVARLTFTKPHPDTGKDTPVYITKYAFAKWSTLGDERMRHVQRKNNQAYPMLVAKILPAGVRGIVVAGLLAALMSSLAGVFNASSTLFTMDFYSRLKPDTSEHELVWTGRLATGAMVVIGLAWIPVIQGAHGLYDYLQNVQGYLAPPIFVVFFLGVFMKRMNAKGCLATLIVGFALGVFRLAVDTPVALIKDFSYTEGSLLWIVNKIYFQYYSLVIFIVCAITMIAVSFATEAPALERLDGLTYGTTSDEDRERSRKSWGWPDVAASVAVIAAILAAYWYFRG
jgi:SSS family transporter